MDDIFDRFPFKFNLIKFICKGLCILGEKIPMSDIRDFYRSGIIKPQSVSRFLEFQMGDEKLKSNLDHELLSSRIHLDGEHSKFHHDLQFLVEV